MKKILSIVLLFSLLLTPILPESNAASTKIQMDKCTVSVKKSFYYTGEGITPTPKVSYKGKKLKKDRDFSVYYKDNMFVGTATITLAGMGKYTGSTTVTFKIKKGKQTINAKNVKAVYGSEDINLSATSSGQTLLSYSSSKKSVATVSPVGVVSIKGVGTAEITIKAEGSKDLAAAKKTITVKVSKAKPEIQAYGGIVKVGKKHDMRGSVNSGGKLTYKSSDKKIATVTKKGIVKTKKAGTVIITVKSTATKNYKSGVKKVKVTVTNN